MISAKHWLTEEEFDSEAFNTPIKTDTDFYYKAHAVMERFANYRSCELQALIFEFRKQIVDNQLLKEFDNHFNIQKSQEGEI